MSGHWPFVAAAYLVAAGLLGALAGWTLAAHRRLRRDLARLDAEEAGGSAPAQGRP